MNVYSRLISILTLRPLSIHTIAEEDLYIAQREYLSHIQIAAKHAAHAEMLRQRIEWLKDHIQNLEPEPTLHNTQWPRPAAVEVTTPTLAEAAANMVRVATSLKMPTVNPSALRARV